MLVVIIWPILWACLIAGSSVRGSVLRKAEYNVAVPRTVRMDVEEKTKKSIKRGKKFYGKSQIETYRNPQCNLFPGCGDGSAFRP